MVGGSDLGTANAASRRNAGNKIATMQVRIPVIYLYYIV